MSEKKKSPFTFFIFIGLIMTAVFAFLFFYYVKFGPFLAYLCGINIATFILYGYDKVVSRTEGILRVPEMVLHLLAFLGGTPFAFLAQQIFRHKTVKGSFRIVFWIILIIQIVLIWQFWHWIYK